MDCYLALGGESAHTQIISSNKDAGSSSPGRLTLSRPLPQSFSLFFISFHYDSCASSTLDKRTPSPLITWAKTPYASRSLPRSWRRLGSLTTLNSPLGRNWLSLHLSSVPLFCKTGSFLNTLTNGQQYQGFIYTSTSEYNAETIPFYGHSTMACPLTNQCQHEAKHN